ncbi:MAG: heparinase II/III domain-containing protein [Puniceicoccales bacterium]
MFKLLSTLSCCLFLLPVVALLRADTLPVASHADPQTRVTEIKGLLPTETAFCGPALTDRAAWEGFGRSYAERIVPAAEKASQSEPPPMPEAVREDYSRNKKRGGEFIANLNSRRYRLKVFTLAECIENQGRFIPALETEMAAILDESTWVMPTHDPDLRNFKGEIVNVDLNAAATGASLATSLALLKEKLPQDLVSRTKEELYRRVVEPYLTRVRSPESKLCYWIDVDNNWNAVCSAGVVLTALYTVDDPAIRAEVVAAAEKSMLEHYLAGFPADGYSLEGLGYWNYGFGHYAILAETLYRMTEGGVDLYKHPVVRPVALFPIYSQMSPGIYPYFADNKLGNQPMWWISRLVNPRVDLPLPTDEQLATSGYGMFMYGVGLTGFPLPEAVVDPQAETLAEESTGSMPTFSEKKLPLRSWFDEAGILICRPGDGDTHRMAVTLKGGDGEQNHTHADLGQFVVAVGNETPLLDPGSENYTAETFTSRRYTIPRIGSFGHSVPVLGGQWQLGGKRAEAEIVQISFSPQTDSYVLDLTDVYDLESLQLFERSFLYSREGACSLQVVDRVQFDPVAPPDERTYEGSLITMGEVEHVDENTLIVSKGDSRVQVRIETHGELFEITEERIPTTRPPEPLRIGVRLSKPLIDQNVE